MRSVPCGAQRHMRKDTEREKGLKVKTEKQGQRDKVRMRGSEIISTRQQIRAIDRDDERA